MKNVYIIWEKNLETKEESFVNVASNLKEALNWIKRAIDSFGDKYAYSISKHYRGTDSFGWKQWKKSAAVINDKIELF